MDYNRSFITSKSEGLYYMPPESRPDMTSFRGEILCAHIINAWLHFGFRSGARPPIKSRALLKTHHRVRSSYPPLPHQNPDKYHDAYTS